MFPRPFPLSSVCNIFICVLKACCSCFIKSSRSVLRVLAYETVTSCKTGLPPGHPSVRKLCTVPQPHKDRIEDFSDLTNALDFTQTGEMAYFFLSRDTTLRG